MQSATEKKYLMQLKLISVYEKDVSLKKIVYYFEVLIFLKIRVSMKKIQSKAVWPNNTTVQHLQCLRQG